jgi:predicted HTH transcriptional regulator
MDSLDALAETLDTELKGWLNLSEPREAALLAKACLAMRNNDGGRVVLGIDNVTMKSIPTSAGFDVYQAYHPDKVNEVVGKSSIPKFEIRVAFKEYDRAVHAELTIPGGIVSPVISRSGLERELRQNAVYVRTISNGRPSSCEPMTAADWDKLIRICFDNREADVGRFMRRHLGDILVQIGTVQTTTGKPSLEKSPEQAALDFLDLGWKHLDSRWTEKFGPKSHG